MHFELVSFDFTEDSMTKYGIIHFTLDADAECDKNGKPKNADSFHAYIYGNYEAVFDSLDDFHSNYSGGVLEQILSERDIESPEEIVAELNKRTKNRDWVTFVIEDDDGYEWQQVYIDKNYVGVDNVEKYLATLRNEYFTLGSGWGNEDNNLFYTTEHWGPDADVEKIKEELSEASGYPVDEIILVTPNEDEDEDEDTYYEFFPQW